MRKLLNTLIKLWQSDKPLFVVITGTVGWVNAIYGPFGSCKDAKDWAEFNAKTDLTNTPWSVVELESPLAEEHIESDI